MVVYLGKATPASGQGGGGSGDAVWGSITGTLSDQTDLANALAGKQDTLTAGSGIDITNNVISVTGGGSSSYDDETINENASNELQAIGLKEARTDTAIRLWHGTEEQWEEGVSQTWYNWLNQNPTLASDEYSMPDSNNWGYVKYGNGKLVAVAGLVYTDNVTYSEDDGETWSTSSMPTGHNTRWNAFAFGDGHFVSIGYNSNVAAYSADGNTWNEVTLPATERWFSLGYGNGRFIAVTQLGSATIYSTDGGESWSEGGNNVSFANTQSSIVYGDGKFIAIGGVNTSSNQTYYTTDGGENWTAGTMSSSQTWMSAAYGNNKFVAVAKGTDTYAYSSDGITWTDGTLPSSANWMSVTFGNGKFVAVADNGKYAYSSDGITWTEDTFTGTGWNSVTYGNNKYFAITLSTHLAAQLAEDAGSYFTSEAEPTTASTVYSAPNTASALTITATGEGTITLSDTNTYAYNSAGNQTTYQSIGEAYPNYICNIEGVGVKIGTTLIADATGTVPTYSAFTGATSQASGSAGLVPAPTTSDVDSYLKGDGTWATLSALENTATGNNSITIFGQPSDQDYSVNIGYDSTIDSTNGEGGIAIGAYGVVAHRGAVAIGYAYDGVYAYQRSVVIGEDARSAKQNSVAIGYNASSDSGNDSIALGYASQVSANKEFFVGFGYDTNNQRLNYKLLDGTTGKIPNDRITADVTPTQNSTNMITSGAVYTVLGDIETLLAAI